MRLIHTVFYYTLLAFSVTLFAQGTGGPGGNGGGGGDPTPCVGKPTLGFEISQRAHPLTSADVGECNLSNGGLTCTFIYTTPPNPDLSGDYITMNLNEEHTCHEGVWKKSNQDILYSQQIIEGANDEIFTTVGGHVDVEKNLTSGATEGTDSHYVRYIVSNSNDFWQTVFIVDLQSLSTVSEWYVIDGNQFIEKTQSNEDNDYDVSNGDIKTLHSYAQTLRFINGALTNSYGVILTDDFFPDNKIDRRNYILANQLTNKAIGAMRKYLPGTDKSSVSVGLEELVIYDMLMGGNGPGIKNHTYKPQSVVISAQYTMVPQIFNSDDPIFDPDPDNLETSIQEILDNVNTWRATHPKLKNWGVDDAFFPHDASDVLLTSGGN